MAATPLIQGTQNLTNTSLQILFTFSGAPGSDPWTLYYGKTDGGTTAANWDHSMSVGTGGLITSPATISGLDPNTVYYFTLFIGGSSNNWAALSPSPQFETRKLQAVPDGMTASYLDAPIRSIFDCEWAGSICPQFYWATFNTVPWNMAKYYSVDNTKVVATVSGSPTHTQIDYSRDSGLHAYSISNSSNILDGGGFTDGHNARVFNCPLGNVNLASAASDGQAWVMKKGWWQINLVTFVNAALKNLAGTTGGPYPVTLQAYPVESFGRTFRGFVKPANALATFYTDSTGVASGSDSRSAKVHLQVDCFWRVSCLLACDTSIPVAGTNITIEMDCTWLG